MAPTRTSHSHGKAGHSADKAGPSKPRPRKSQPEREPTGPPGVQKLKSSLRQTRRLLSKDNLAADVRVETERRLRALEADLVQAESSKKERTLAVRYHKIKFFERQKVVRKLHQTKKHLSTADASLKSQLEASLSALRVDLNYIMHYPKTKKYISLFPPEMRQADEEPQTSPSAKESGKTDADREEMRTWIRGRMEKGELSQTPELDLDSRPAKSLRKDNWDEKDTPKKPLKQPTATTDAVEDTFFGDDDDEDNSDEASWQ